MEIQHALDQLREIHERLAHSEVYRGYRGGPVALSGALAIVAAAAQPALTAPQSPRSFAIYWMAVAIVGAATAGAGILRNYLVERDARVRARTRAVVGQLAPSLVAGAFIAAVAVVAAAPLIPCLPGLWAILFSLGVFASRPYLPRIIGWVALFYFGAGSLMLAWAAARGTASPWGMGLTFGIGQALAGAVLYWNLERRKRV